MHKFYSIELCKSVIIYVTLLFLIKNINLITLSYIIREYHQKISDIFGLE